MKPDYARIRELEYELGLRDDPPVNDRPGSVLRYKPPSSVRFATTEESRQVREAYLKHARARAAQSR